MGGYHTWTVGEVLTAANMNTYVRDQVVSYFADTATRNAAITSPFEGQLCWVDSTGELYRRKGTAWVSAVDRVIYNTTNRTRTDTLVLGTASMSFPVEANSTYIMQMNIGVISFGTESNGISFGWTTPSGVSGNWYLGGFATSSMPGSNTFYPEVWRGAMAWSAVENLGIESSEWTFLDGYGWLVTGGNAGTMDLQFAEYQAVTGSTSVSVSAGSSIIVTKVA